MQGTARKSLEEEEEDDDDFDYEDRVLSVMRARGKRLDFHENANFNHEDPGLHEVGILAFIASLSGVVT